MTLSASTVAKVFKKLKLELTDKWDGRPCEENSLAMDTVKITYNLDWCSASAQAEMFALINKQLLEQVDCELPLTISDVRLGYTLKVTERK